MLTGFFPVCIFAINTEIFMVIFAIKSNLVFDNYKINYYFDWKKIKLRNGFLTKS